jgi:hypothetical protein
LKKATTYRPSALLLLAVLLFAVFGKELHHLVHHHGHEEQLHCHADEGETHLHDSRYAFDSCALCLFHISPLETPEMVWPPKAPSFAKIHIHSFSSPFLLKSIERLLPARAPPMPIC